MKKKIVYFISYYGEKHMCWDDEKKRFIPAALKLYRSTYEDLFEAMRVHCRVQKNHSGWHDNIFIDSEIAWIDL